MRAAQGPGLRRGGLPLKSESSGAAAAATPLRSFVLLMVLFGSLAAWFVPRMEPSGDEPHYLVMAQSLWREHDLDLRDNYAREDWREFRSGPTEPHYAAPRQDGRPFPGHAPGLPLILAPLYALGGRLACVFLLGAMVAASGALAQWIARKEGLSNTAALLAAVLAAGPPLSAFSLHVYTEAPVALALVAAYALLRFDRTDKGAALAAALACALPMLHPRMAASSLGLALAAFLLLEGRALFVFVATSILGASAYGLFWMSVFGTPTGLGMYGGVPEDFGLAPLRAALGLLLDRAYGILPVAPAFLVLAMVPGAASTGTARETRLRRVEWALVLSILLPVLFWRVWWGGQSPPARLIAPMTPFLALWVARRWENLATMARRALLAALLWSWGLFLFAALQPGRLLFINRRVRPTRLWDALFPVLDRVLPDLARPEFSDWVRASAWLAALAVLVWFARRPRPSARTRTD